MERNVKRNIYITGIMALMIVMISGISRVWAFEMSYNNKVKKTVKLQMQHTILMEKGRKRYYNGLLLYLAS